MGICTPNSASVCISIRRMQGSISLTAILFLILTVSFACGDVDVEHSDDLITFPVDTLQIVLEIGKEIGDSTEIFGSIIDADIDKQGRIHVLDQVSCRIMIYDMQGNYIRCVSHRGAGPGECYNPMAMFIMPDGRVGICASDKGGYIVFNDSLELEEEIRCWPNNSPYHVTAINNNRLAVCRYDDTECNGGFLLHHTVAIFRWGEQEWDTILWKDSLFSDDNVSSDPSEELLFVMFHDLNTGGIGDGTVYFAPLDPFEYQVLGWDTSGTEVLNITRDMTPVEKTPEEIADESSYLNSSFQTRFGDRGFNFQAHSYRNMILSVGIGPDGNLWVRRGTRNGLFFDIFNLDGNILRHAVFQDDGWSWRTDITPHGILAWELDPLEGYQTLFLLK